MKILIYTSKFPPLIGGVENVTYNLAKNFKEQGHSVFVITSFLLNNKKDIKNLLSIKSRLTSYKTIKNVRVFMSMPRSFLGYLSFLYRFVRSIFYTRKLIKKYNPSVINYHFPDDSLYYFYFVTLWLDYPIYTNIHGNEVHLFSKGLVYRFFLNKILNKSKKVIVNSNFMLNELLKVYSISNINVISNGIDLKSIKLSKKKFEYKPGSYFLFIGRFDVKKGLDVLINAFNEIADKISRKLIIVGGASGENKHGALSEKYIREIVKSDKIILAGRIPQEEVFNYYKNAYYSVFPSLYEPFGIVALESMSVGTPIIASSGGFKEILDKTYTGITFEPKSVSQLKKALIKADSTPSLHSFFSKNALKSVRKYDWKEISKQYIRVFSDL